MINPEPFRPGYQRFNGPHYPNEKIYVATITGAGSYARLRPTFKTATAASTYSRKFYQRWLRLYAAGRQQEQKAHEQRLRDLDERANDSRMAGQLEATNQAHTRSWFDQWKSRLMAFLGTFWKRNKVGDL